MRKIVILFAFVSALIIPVAVRAEMNKNDVKACLASALGATWNETKAAPHCVCPANYFSLLDPGKFKPYVNKYLDLCESTDKKKWSSNMKKPKGDGTVTAPAKFFATLEPADSKAKASATIELHLNVASGASQIAQVRAIGENCLSNGKAYFTDSAVKGPTKGPWDYPIGLTAADPTVGGRAKVIVHAVTKDGVDHQYEATAEWEPKAPPPAPVIVAPPVVSECVNTHGTDGVNRHCLCTGDLIEVSRNGVWVCEQAPKQEVAKAKVSVASRIHPLVEPKCLAAKSDTFKAGECFMDLGLTADILDWLKWYGTVGMGTPGATNTDADGTAVKLSNGKDDKRKLSFLIETGLRFRLYDPLGLRAGGFRRMDGETNGITDPIHVSTGGLLGLDLGWPVGSHTMGFGLAGTVGSHKKGSMNSNAEIGVMLNLSLELWTGK